MAGDKEGALCWSRRAALNGSGYAAIDLAQAYETGAAAAPGSRFLYYPEPDKVFAVQKDDAEAARWYALAARSKDQFIPAQAMIKLGDRYASGVGVPRNDVEAVRWYRKARAADENAYDMSLPDMYRGGFGVVRDDRKAMQALLTIIGGVTARAQYGAMVVEGVTSLDNRWTSESIGDAAEEGYVEAMLIYGRMLAKGGDGVDKDVGEARRCLALAAQLGQLDAAAELAKLPPTDPPHTRQDPFMTGKVGQRCRP
jgi:TPR repeat protein